MVGGVDRGHHEVDMGAPASVSHIGVGFPFRDFVVARSCEARADAAATHVAQALADRVGGAVAVRAEDESLELQARHAALVAVGTPSRRRRGGNASVLARRLRVPVVVVPRRADLDLAGARSVVCGVRDPHDTASVAAAGAFADALDLQLVLVHVWDEPTSRAGRPLAFAPGIFDPDRPQNQAAMRELLGVVAARAGRCGPGAASLRVIDGAVGVTLCRTGGEEQAALVALTASRLRPFAAVLLGSNVRFVTRHADRPVLVCPDQPDPGLGLRAHHA
jgi:nucleotide-binding universal stress UspA family protein